MGMWDRYEARIGVSGDTSDDPKRTSAFEHIKDRTQRKITSSLSYKNVKINGTDRKIAVIDEQAFDTKRIFSMPDEDLPHGSLVEWADSLWLITELNAHRKPYSEGKMRRCNYNLKWIDDNGNILSRWCIVEDGTKYLIGERAEDIITIGDARIAVTIGKDKDTSKLSRGKRFLIDDMDSTDVLAFEITKPNKFFNVYNGRGVFRFIMGEVNLTDDDNKELRIADYYSWKPKVQPAKPDTKVDVPFDKIISDAIKEKENMPDNIEKGKVWI